MVSCVKPECIPASRELDPNPDIEGIGFLLAFALSAFLTLFICIISYFLNQDSLSNQIDRLFIQFVADRGFIKKFTKWVSKILKIQGVDKWNKALQMAVLSFSDQQVFTGLAILISGYVQLGCRGLAVYDWQIVVDLAFFSSVTHLTTLTCLRTYFQTRNILRLTRLICMGVIAIMLGCALWSAGYLNGPSTLSARPDIEASFPAWCLYDRRAMSLYLASRGGLDNPESVSSSFAYRSFNIAYIVIVLLYLGTSYTTKFFGLFPEISKALLAIFPLLAQTLRKMRRKVRDRASGKMSDGTREDRTLEMGGTEDRKPNQSKGAQRFWKSLDKAISAVVFVVKMVTWLCILSAKTIIRTWTATTTGDITLFRFFFCVLPHRAILSILYVGQAVNELYRSVIWDITWLSIALSWGTVRIYNDRTHPALDLGSGNLSSVLTEIDTWAFAQVIPCILLALPLLSLCESFSDLRNNDTPHAADVGQVASPVTPPASTTQTDEHASTSPTIQHFTPTNSQERQDHGLYEYVWFRKTVLLTYLLSVAVGIDMLFNFPNGRVQIYGELPNILDYIVWICVDLFIIWLFLFVNLCMHDVEPYEPTLHWRHRGADVPQRKYAKALDILVAILLYLSIFYNLLANYRLPLFG